MLLNLDLKPTQVKRSFQTICYIDAMPSKRGAGADPDQTKRRLIDAAFETVLLDGYAGASARAIATRAGCNQASIYYHFGGIEQLLVATLHDSNNKRFTRYQAAIEPLTDVQELLNAWKTLHVEDEATGHVTVLTEMVGAIGAEPSLRDGLRDVVDVWTSFVGHTIDRLSAVSPLAKLIPREDAAAVVFALFLGVELLTKLDQDTGRANRLFTAATTVAGLFPTTT
jgi:AcrR family transcriptional regulator